MAISAYFKVLESPRGNGMVFQNEKMLSRVSYELSVLQQMIVAGDGEQEGLKLISGTLSVLKGKTKLWGFDRLTLHLQDGRNLDFFIKEARLVSNEYIIQPTGSFY